VFHVPDIEVGAPQEFFEEEKVAGVVFHDENR
jgi:hypothetical protein